MKILHIDVRGKIATYRSRDGEIVCGNTDYKVQFSLDEEWEGLEKTARFIWNGQYFDTPLLDDDSCVVPVISNAEAVVVGLYAENLHTTTSAIIYCKRSILCGDVEPNPGTGLNYTTEAQKAANEAKASATQAQVFAGQATSRAAEAINAANTAKEAADTAKATAATLVTLEPKIEHNALRIEKIEDKLGLDSDLVVIKSGYSEEMASGATQEAQISYKYIRLLKLGSFGQPEYYAEYGGWGYSKHYISRIGNGGSEDIILPTTVLNKLPFYGYGNCDNGRYANYIFFENGKAYYHQGCRYYDSGERAELAEGEIFVNEYNGDGMYKSIIGLAEPIITDISAELDFDGVIETNINITGVVGGIAGVYGKTNILFYGYGYYEFAYMTKEGV